MKKIFILFLVATIATTVVFAEQKTLIDFNTLTADYPPDNPVENEATLINYGQNAGSSFTDEDKDKMITSLRIENWEVVLNSPARSVKNQSLSYTRSAPVDDDAGYYKGENILGIRVHFPVEPFNAWALVKPPFEIPAYSDIKTEVNAEGKLVASPEEKGRGDQFSREKDDGASYGVVKNIGVIKSISVNVYGQNFPHALSIILKNHQNIENEYLLGYLNFDGWKTLTWNNEGYIKDVRNRELRTFPLYPTFKPMQKLIGFRIYRDADQPGGDSIAYIKDVSIEFDKAVLDSNRDIDDEKVWGILEDREVSRSKAEDGRLRDLQVLRFLEAQKQPDDSAPQGQGQEQANEQQ